MAWAPAVLPAGDPAVLADVDASAQDHAWAVADLHRCAREALNRLAGRGEEEGGSLWQLRVSLENVLDRRCNQGFQEGLTLNILWSLPDMGGNFRELERCLRVIVVRRVQSRLYSLLMEHYGGYRGLLLTEGGELHRSWFLQHCWFQLGHEFEDKAEDLFMAYHKEFGSRLSKSRLLLRSNLFPSAAEAKAEEWARRHGVARRVKPKAKKNRNPQDDVPDQRSPQLTPTTSSSEDEAATPQTSSSSSPRTDHEEVQTTVAADADAAQTATADAEETLSVTSLGKYAGEAWFGAGTQYSQTERDGQSECGEARDGPWWYDWCKQGNEVRAEYEPPEFKPYSKALVLLELVHVLAWVDKQRHWTTPNFCDVEGVTTKWISGESYRMHYRLESVLKMLVNHERCVLGVTFCNNKHDDVGGPMLCKLLQECTGDQWDWCADEKPRYAYSPDADQKIYVWTPLDGITQKREAEGKHRYSKTCGQIWQDLSRTSSGDVCQFGKCNTICLDLSKSNFDHIDNVIVAHEWQQAGWCKGIPEDPPVYPEEEEAKDGQLRSCLEDILNSVSDDCEKDLREKIQLFSSRCRH